MDDPASDPAEARVISHGICDDCITNIEFQEGVGLPRFLDSLKAPVLLYDNQDNVAFPNLAACSLLGRERTELTGMSPGLVFECQYARYPQGCGKTVHCSGCAIRIAIERTAATGKGVLREPATLTQYDKEICLLISTEKRDTMILLRIDELMGGNRPEHPGPVQRIPGSLRIIPGQWLNPVDFSSAFDLPDQPLHVDLGCGMGRFLLARAARHPNVNFLGLDRQLNRLKRIDRKAIRAGLTHIRLLRAELMYTVSYLFAEESVDTFFLFYPDPWPKGKHRHNRLVTAHFLDNVFRALKPGGSIHISTDDLPYYKEMRRFIAQDERFRETDPLILTDDERTDFELVFHNKKPNRCSFIKDAFRAGSPYSSG